MDMGGISIGEWKKDKEARSVCLRFVLISPPKSRAHAALIDEHAR